MNKDDLHARLDALNKKITDAQRALFNQSAWSDGHKLSSGEFKARYSFLKSELDGEIEDLQAHGHHVSALEASVREWFDSLNLKTK
jgi:hypothetical protein